MGKGTAAFTIGVAIIVGIVAIVGASVFASSQANKVQGYADEQVAAVRTETSASLEEKADKSFGQFDRLSAEEASVTATSVKDYASIGGALDVAGDASILGSLAVWASGDPDPVLEVVPGGVNLAQVTSAGNIQNMDGTFVVDASGALQAASGNFSGDLEAAGAAFTGLSVKAGSYTLAFAKDGFSISYPGTMMGFNKSLGALNDWDLPYLFSDVVRTNSIKPVNDDGAIEFPTAFTSDNLTAGWIGSPSANLLDKAASAKSGTSSDWVMTSGTAVMVDGFAKQAVVVNGLLRVNKQKAEFKSGAEVDGGLTADTATITTGNVTNLTAGTATITTGNVTNLTAGTAGITTLTAGDSTVTGALHVGTIDNGGAAIQVADDVSIAGSLAVLDTITADSVVARSLEATGALAVAGTAEFTGSSFSIDTSNDATATIADGLQVGNLEVLGTLKAPTIDLDITSGIEIGSMELNNALRLDTAQVDVIAGDFIVDPDNKNGTANFVIDGTTGETTLPGALTVAGRVAVGTGDFAVDVDDDGTNDFVIDRGTLATTLPGSLTVGNVTGGTVDATYVIADSGIDNGTGTWAGTATIAAGNTAVTVDPGVTPQSILVTPMLASGQEPLADYGVTAWWTVDNGDGTFDIVADAVVTANMQFSYMVVR